ncbi:MAG: efflux RND transporter periplasmic adaptor subunit [Vicinamibacterales bacterium]
MRGLLTNVRVIIGGLVIAGLLAVALWPRATPVDLATVARGPLRVTIDEEGETRVRHRYVVSAPVAGRVLRIDLEPGDVVTSGETVVARLRADTPPLLDARSRQEAEAARAAARAALGRAEADQRRAEAALALSQKELERVHELDASGLATRQQVDAAEAEARTAGEAAQAARYAVATARSQLQQAEARLRPDSLQAAGRVLELTAPIDGVVLRRLRESESAVPAGEPLLEIGDPKDLEIVSDLLSTDAVQVEPGARVLLEEWGGQVPIEARVRRVEPSGFTKVSALGVEEQRVNVVMDFADPAGAWTELGDGYRVEVRIVTWEADDVLTVPTSALFRRGEGWAVYEVRDGRVHETSVTIGHRNGVDAEVLAGIEAGATVVVHPPDTIAEDARVEARQGE